MPRYVIPIIKAIKEIITEIKKYIYDKVRVLDKVTGKLRLWTSETISFLANIFYKFIKKVYLVLDIKEQINSFLKGTLKDLIKLKDLVSGKFLFIINETIFLVIKIISKFLMKIQISLNISEEIKLILKKLIQDIIRLSDKVSGKFLIKITETISLFIKTIIRLIYKVYLVLNISEYILGILKGLTKDSIKLKDYLLGKFVSIIQETITFYIRIQYSLKLVGKLILNINESILNILKGAYVDHVKFKDYLIGKFLRTVQETIILVIRITSRIFYKFYLTLNITESIIKILKGLAKDLVKISDIIIRSFSSIERDIVRIRDNVLEIFSILSRDYVRFSDIISRTFIFLRKDFIRLSDLVKGKFLRKIDETITFSIKILSMFKPYYARLTLNISESIINILKGLKGDIIKFSDRISCLFFSTPGDLVRMKDNISRIFLVLSKDFIKFLDLIYRTFVTSQKDIVKLLDLIKVKVLKRIYETISFSTRVLFMFKPYRIRLTLLITELIKKYEKGPTRFDEHKFDEVTFDTFTKEV